MVYWIIALILLILTLGFNYLVWFKYGVFHNLLSRVYSTLGEETHPYVRVSFYKWMSRGVGLFLLGLFWPFWDEPGGSISELLALFVMQLLMTSMIPFFYVWNKAIHRAVHEENFSRTDVQEAAINVGTWTAVSGFFVGLGAIIAWSTGENNLYELGRIDIEGLMMRLAIIPFCILCYPLFVVPFFLLSLLNQRRLSKGKRRRREV